LFVPCHHRPTLSPACSCVTPFHASHNFLRASPPSAVGAARALIVRSRQATTHLQ
jgi:hypothetical protein